MSKRMPKRIQRKRTKGWRMPEGAVYVGRPTKWGNPFTNGPKGENVLNFRALVAKGNRNYLRELKRTLRGKDLACWCPLDQSCHADVLLELANKPE